MSATVWIVWLLGGLIVWPLATWGVYCAMATDDLPTDVDEWFAFLFFGLVIAGFWPFSLPLIGLAYLAYRGMRRLAAMAERQRLQRLQQLQGQRIQRLQGTRQARWEVDRRTRHIAELERELGIGKDTHH
jgi:hypothetical protein